MQQIKNITKTTKTTEKSVHLDAVYAVIENCYNNLQVVEYDCTGANYFLASANIFAQLQELYASNMHYNEYVSLQSVMDIFANNITYYDEESLFTDVVKNTALEKINLQDYTCLSN